MFGRSQITRLTFALFTDADAALTATQDAVSFGAYEYTGTTRARSV
jgi:hypothetical protein